MNQFSWQCTHLHSIDTFFSVLQILEQQHVVGHVFSSAMAIASARHSETVISYFAPAAADIIRRHQMCGFFHVCDVFFDQLLFTPNDRTTWPKKRKVNLIREICLDFLQKISNVLIFLYSISQTLILIKTKKCFHTKFVIGEKNTNLAIND